MPPALEWYDGNAAQLGLVAVACASPPGRASTMSQINGSLSRVGRGSGVRATIGKQETRVFGRPLELSTRRPYLSDEKEEECEFDPFLFLKDAVDADCQ